MKFIRHFLMFAFVLIALFLVSLGNPAKAHATDYIYRTPAIVNSFGATYGFGATITTGAFYLDDISCDGATNTWTLHPGVAMSSTVTDEFYIPTTAPVQGRSYRALNTSGDYPGRLASDPKAHNGKYYSAGAILSVKKAGSATTSIGGSGCTIFYHD